MRFSLKTLMLLVLLAAIICAVVLYWDYIPGTVHLDKFKTPRGTGWLTRNFSAGGPMEKAYYRAGELIEKIWYKPDGSIAATSTFHRDGINVSYEFRQDGSLEAMFQCKYFYEEGLHKYYSDGLSIQFKPDGSISRTEQYRNGVPINSPDGIIIR